MREATWLIQTGQMVVVKFVIPVISEAQLPLPLFDIQYYISLKYTT